MDDFFSLLCGFWIGFTVGFLLCGFFVGARRASGPDDNP